MTLHIKTHDPCQIFILVIIFVSGSVTLKSQVDERRVSARVPLSNIIISQVSSGVE